MATSPHKVIRMAKADGTIRTFTVDRNAHTLTFEIDVLERTVLGEFVKTFIQQHKTNAYMKPVIDELIGQAIGYYEVSITDLYPDLNDIYELSDRALVSVVRWRNRREKEKTDGTQ